MVWVKMTYFHRFFQTIPGVLVLRKIKTRHTLKRALVVIPPHPTVPQEGHNFAFSENDFFHLISFLDALASLKTKLDIKSLTFSRLQDSKSITDYIEYYRVLQSLTESDRVLQSLTESYRVLRITEYHRVLQSIKEYYRVLQSITE